MLGIVFLGLFSSLSFATVTIGNVNCPQKFEGKVEEIIDDSGPSHAFSTQRVIFQNLRTIRGEVGEQIQVDLLKHGPLDIKRGEEYSVQVRDGRICWIEEI